MTQLLTLNAGDRILVNGREYRLTRQPYGSSRSDGIYEQVTLCLQSVDVEVLLDLSHVQVVRQGRYNHAIIRKADGVRMASYIHAAHALAGAHDWNATVADHRVSV